VEVPIVWKQDTFSATRGNDLEEFDEAGLFLYRMGWDGTAWVGLGWSGLGEWSMTHGHRSMDGMHYIHHITWHDRI
jgi:hypothetical protein